MSYLEYELIILDRDGVLNVRNKFGYILKPEELTFPSDLNVLSKLSEERISFAVATNQQCVGLGLISHDLAIEISKTPLRTIGVGNPNVFLCPHLISENCRCRKPLGGLIEQALNFTKIDKGLAIMVGDSVSDMEAAQNAGVDFLGVCWDGDCLGLYCCHTLTGVVERVLFRK